MNIQEAIKELNSVKSADEFLNTFALNKFNEAQTNDFEGKFKNTWLIGYEIISDTEIEIYYGKGEENNMDKISVKIE